MPTTIESLDALADATAVARQFRLAWDEARAVAAAAEAAFAEAERRLVGLARQVAGCEPADDIVLGPRHFIPHDEPEPVAVRIIGDGEADLAAAADPKPAAEPVVAIDVPAGPTWRKLTLEAAGMMDVPGAEPIPEAWPEEIQTPILRAGVKTCGELADALLKGEKFGLRLVDVETLWEAVELLSEDDDEPIRFTPAEAAAEGDADGDDPPPVSVGDVIRTSYGTGPYVVKSITRPNTPGHKWSLTLDDANPKKGSKSGTSWINEVERQPDGRITSLNGNDELFVVPKGQPHGPDYFDWCRNAGLVRENGNKELQLKWMRGEPAPAIGAFTPTPELPAPTKSKPSSKKAKSGAKVTQVMLANGPATIVSHPDAQVPGEPVPAAKRFTLLAEIDNFPDVVFDKLFHSGITSLETLLERVEVACQQIADMPLRNKLVTYFVDSGVKMRPAEHAADAVADYVASHGPSAVIASTCAPWRDRTLVEAGVTEGPAAWATGTLQRLKRAGVTTFGQLADKLRAGEHFLLLREPLREMCDAVEALSSGDPEPITFADVPKPTFESESKAEAQIESAKKPAAAGTEKPYGWSITYSTDDGREERCHYTGTEVKACRRTLARPGAKNVISCEPLTEQQYTVSFGRGGM